MHLRDLKLLVELPKACKTWVDITNKESTMYVENMIALSPFEIETCPWWIDMPSPHVLPSEKAKFEEWQKSKGKDASGGCLGQGKVTSTSVSSLSLSFTFLTKKWF